MKPRPVPAINRVIWPNGTPPVQLKLSKRGRKRQSITHSVNDAVGGTD